MSELSRIRVRFAPSPTGFLHVGGLRTALYNFLFARKHEGVFVLRIEDTDRSRFVEGAVSNLIDTLHWSGLDFDEGPGKPGDFGPYVQSERLDLYRSHIQQLLEQGHAYRCFCTAERLDAMRKNQEKLGLAIKYDRHCLGLSRAEIDGKISRNEPFTVRMKVPAGSPIRFHDLIRDEVEFSSEMVDDQVLLKSDGYPTYHFANVVDDHLMKISHVIRGEEWLSSTPKHVLLYRYFGWDIPVFAHLPLLLNPDRSKLSKRQGDVAVEEYRAKGYLSEALVNFVALLGWNPGTEQEVFSLSDLVNQFSLERVNKAGAVFAIDKLNWLNFEYLRRKPLDEVLRMLKSAIAQSNFRDRRFDDDYLRRVIEVMRERTSFVGELLVKSSYFFEAPIQYEEEAVRKRWKEETPAELQKLAEAFSGLQQPTRNDFESSLQQCALSLNIKPAKLIHATRLAVSGVSGGPGLYDILEILGKEETVRRIQKAIGNIHL